MALTVYGDFNCPFSALASHRVDVLVALGIVGSEFRAVEHSPRIPPDGLAVVDERLAGLTDEVAEVLGFLTPADGTFALRVPEVLPNTATMCEAYASTPTADLRDQLFSSVWGDGVAKAVVTDDGVARKAEWQAILEGWGPRTVPTLVTDGGDVIRGREALRRLGDLLTTSS